MNDIDFDHPPVDPIAACEAWFQWSNGLGIPNPNSMTLATVDSSGRPSARIVLLRGFDARGAVFYTNRLSRKGVELSANDYATLLFHWDQSPLGRQLRISGSVTHTSEEESDAYWKTRPRESQINAWASQQSQPVANRAELERANAEFGEKFHGLEIRRPPHWGGYRVSLECIEFWLGHAFRLHDRIVYSRHGTSWRVQRLNP